MSILSHDEIHSLSPSDRLTLIGALWDSLDERDVPLTTAQKAEMYRRLETLEEDSKSAISLEDFMVKWTSR